jgi:DNA-binding transcriptional regulator YhcF (GntR family)
VAAEDAQEDKRPASRRVADALQGQIDSGELAPGDPLPTYRQLAADHDVAVNTAMAAVRLLRDAGAVTIRPNAGASVRNRSEEVDLVAEINQARSEIADLRALAQQVNSALSKLETRLTDLADRIDKTT